jgi:hypothetical protein
MKMLNILALLVLSAVVLAIPAAAQNRKAVSAAEVNGTFRNRSGSEFSILAIGDNKLKIEFVGLYPYKLANGDAMVNTGEANGVAVIEGDTAVFKPAEFEETCTITLKFTKPGRLEVEEEGSQCGFGHNVTPGGSYRKISSRKPKFDW